MIPGLELNGCFNHIVLLQQTVSVVQAASVLAVMTTPAVSAPALVVMEPVAHVTRTSANVTMTAALESPETVH